MHLHIYAYWQFRQLVQVENICLHQFVYSVTIRVHAGVVLIESYLKRSIQLELLEKFDEIDKIFNEKLKIKTNNDRLRRRFRQSIIFCTAKCFLLLSTVLLGAFLVHSYRLLIAFAMAWAPLYNCTSAHFFMFNCWNILTWSNTTSNRSTIVWPNWGVRCDFIGFTVIHNQCPQPTWWMIPTDWYICVFAIPKPGKHRCWSIDVLGGRYCLASTRTLCFPLRIFIGFYIYCSNCRQQRRYRFYLCALHGLGLVCQIFWNFQWFVSKFRNR